MKLPWNAITRLPAAPAVLALLVVFWVVAAIATFIHVVVTP